MSDTDDTRRQVLRWPTADGFEAAEEFGDNHKAFLDVFHQLVNMVAVSNVEVPKEVAQMPMHLVEAYFGHDCAASDQRAIDAFIEFSETVKKIHEEGKDD